MESRDSPDRLSQLLLAHQRNRVDRDALASDVVPVSLRDRSLRDHAHLGAAADHDHPLAVDALKRWDPAHLGDPVQAFKVRHQARFVAGAGYLELQLSEILTVRPAGDVRDIRAVLEDHLAESI